MASGTDLGTIFASIKLNVSGLTTGITTVKRDISSASQYVTKHLGEIERAGRSLTTGITVPFAAAGVAATKFSMDFRTTMAQIVGLAGATTDEIDGIAKACLDLSPAAGRGPQELGEAMYFIQSSGVKGAAAVDILTQSARAAAAGLGETKVVADLATSAVNAYGAENLTAAQTTDILVAAVREGKGEADELAKSVGRVLPVSARMGIDFANVAAAMATMTRSGLDTDEAATALRATLTALLDPAKQTEKALASVGLTAAGVRKELSENLITGLSHLASAFKGNDELLAQIFPNIRGLLGVLNLTGQSAETVAEIFDAVSNSAGSTDDAFKAIEQTAGFKLKQAFAQLQVEAIKLGDTASPAVAAIAVAVGGLAEAFGSLGTAGNTAIIGIGAFAASIGPLMMTIAGTKNALLTLGVAAETLSVVFSGPVLAAIAATAAAIVGLVALYKHLHRETTAEAQESLNTAHAHTQQAEKTKALVEQYSKLNPATAEARKVLRQIADVNPDIIRGFDAQGKPMGLIADAWRKIAYEADQAYKNEVKAAQALNIRQRADLLKKKSDAEDQIRALQKEVISRTKTTFSFVPGVGAGVTGGTPYIGTASDADITRKLEQINKLGHEIDNINAKYKSLLPAGKALAQGRLPDDTGTTPAPTKRDSGNAAPSGGGVSRAKASSVSNQRETAAENIVTATEQRIDKLRDKLESMLQSGNTTSAVDVLKQLNKETINLVDANNKLGEVQKSGAKTAADKQRIDLATADAVSAANNAYISDKQRVASKEIELAQQRKRNSKEAADQEARIEAELAQQRIDYAVATGKKQEALWLKLQKDMSEASKAADPDLAMATASQNYFTSKQELAKQAAEFEIEQARKAESEYLAILRYKYEHDLVSRDQYISILMQKQAAEEQYTAKWRDYSYQIEAVLQDQTNAQIRAAEAVAESNNKKALEMLQTDLAAYQAMGNAGVESARRIQEAIDRLGKAKQKDTINTQAWANAWAQEVMNIADSFANAIADMVTGTGSFADFMKRTFHELLRWIISYFLKNLLSKWMEATKVMAESMASATGGASSGGGGGWASSILGAIGGAVGGGIGSIIGGAIGGLFGFDSPTNDTFAVRSGADFSRLFRQGFESDIDRSILRPSAAASPTTNTSTTVNHNESITVQNSIAELNNAADVDRVLDNAAWIISRKLSLVPTS